MMFPPFFLLSSVSSIFFALQCFSVSLTPSEMNSSTKRMKTEPSPTAELNLEPTGTANLYKLIPGARWSHLFGSRRIYPISPFIGWSYMKEASSKEVSHFFRPSQENPGVGATPIFLLLALLFSVEKVLVSTHEYSYDHVFASDSKNFLRFAFYLPSDKAHPNSEPNPEPVPVNSIISLELVTGSGNKCDIELKRPSSMESGVKRVLICKSDDGRLPTIQIKGLKATPIIPKGFEVTPQTVLTPFSLLDKENKRYSCHKEILEDNWPFLRMKLEENPILTEMKTEGGSATVDVVLHHFYYPQKPVPPINSFGMALELLKVAHQLQIPKLLALAVDTLIEKMDRWGCRVGGS
ncbi:hypothetical protein Ocin01_19086 [Orchesella cincta]|uniref:Uncharacterized protein n=1 Tax=Orchesella cincta TaxID=48709 RepID=A0A1D2M3S0_ORCCI|nr:hypothetical protein Ocin01_19086 [Orchesella cincta]